MRSVLTNFLLAVGLGCALFATTVPSAAAPATNAVAPLNQSGGGDPIARIRDEGLNRSQVMKTLSYLSDVIGPRLTGSPNLRRANAWTRDTLVTWGLTNAHLEAWGPFGRGWSLQRFSAQVIEPQAFPLIAAPKAWTPGLAQPISAEVILFEAKTEGDLDKYKGHLQGAIVLMDSTREVKLRFEPLASRIGESNLLRMANAGPTDTRPFTPGRASAPINPPSTNTATPKSNIGPTNIVTPKPAPATTNTAKADAGAAQRTNSSAALPSGRALSFVTSEGAALVVTPSSQGDGGTLFVEQASVPLAPPAGTNSPAPASRQPWATNAPVMPPQIALATEDYNRLVRMIRHGEKLKMAVDLQVRFHSEDPMAYNTIAEIPGGDLKAEVVMLGAHLDSWHSGTGATDNGAGVAATMEAVRILKALNLQPRRTIRIGLWSGEEQNLLGSKAYVAKHLGYYTNLTSVVAARSPRDEGKAPRLTTPAATNAVTKRLVRTAEYEKFSAYFNLDNGTGKIRGVYMQGNESVRPLFRKWLQPFSDLGAETLTYGNTAGTDHQSFDGIGLPGFQFIQDPLDYWTRTHHSNADVFDRIQADDMKQISTILAAFIYHASMVEEKVPRKPVE